jgi:hypothetical protein
MFCPVPFPYTFPFQLRYTFPALSTDVDGNGKVYGIA